jgi:hypothetical protein
LNTILSSEIIFAPKKYFIFFWKSSCFFFFFDATSYYEVRSDPLGTQGNEAPVMKPLWIISKHQNPSIFHFSIYDRVISTLSSAATLLSSDKKRSGTARTKMDQKACSLDPKIAEAGSSRLGFFILKFSSFKSLRFDLV